MLCSFAEFTRGHAVCSVVEFTRGVHAVQMQIRPTTCGLGHHLHFGLGKQYKGEQAPQSTKPTHLDILKDTVAALKKMNLTYLTTPTTTASSDPMPKTTTRTRAQVTAIPNTTAAALTIQPITSNELLLLTALREAESWNARAEVHAFELQASNILNEAYTERLRKALEAREEKQGKKKGIKLVGDGLPKLLSGDNFYELAQAKEKEVREVLKQKEARKEGRVAYDAAIEEWAVADQERKDERDAIKANNTQTKAAWDKRKAAAVKKKKKFTEPKPKATPLPKAIPRPKLKDFLDGGGGVVSAGEAEDDAGSDGDEVGSEGSASDDDDA
jgi:cell division septation protein DedD